MEAGDDANVEDGHGVEGMAVETGMLDGAVDGVAPQASQVLSGLAAQLETAVKARQQALAALGAEYEKPAHTDPPGSHESV